MLRKQAVTMVVLGVGLFGCNGDGGVSSGTNDVSQQSLTFETKYDFDKNSPLLAEYDVYYGTIQLYGSKTDEAYIIDSYSYIVDDSDMVIDVENTVNGQIISSEELELRIETDNDGVTVQDYSNNMTWRLSAEQLIDLGVSTELFETSNLAVAQKAVNDVPYPSDVDMSERIHFSVSQCSRPFEGTVTATLPKGTSYHKVPLIRLADGFTYMSAQPFTLKEQLWDDAIDRIANLKEANPESCGLVDQALGALFGKAVSDMDDYIKSKPEDYSKIREHLENHSHQDAAKRHSYGFLKIIGAIEAIEKTLSIYDYANDYDTKGRLEALRNATGIFDTAMCLTKDTKFDSILPEKYFGTLNQGYDSAIIAANTALSYIQETFKTNSSGTVNLYVTAKSDKTSSSFNLEFNPSMATHHEPLECTPEVEIDAPSLVYIDSLTQINILTRDQLKNNFVTVKAKSVEGSLGDEPPAPSGVILDKSYIITEEGEQQKQLDLPPSQVKATQIIEAKVYDENNNLLATDTKSVQILLEPIDCGSVDLVINQEKTYSDAYQYCSSVGMKLLNSSQAQAHRAELQQCLSKYDWVWLSGSDPDAATANAYEPVNGLLMPWGTWREMVVACTN
ncbi:TPA: hypothetical protein N2737_000551 [Vibrio parahaemolyticus]|nr:hypothetical protein [Vibrio parahaemolyticus]